MRRGLLCGAILFGVLAWSGVALGAESFRMLHPPEAPFRYYVDARAPQPAGIQLGLVAEEVRAAYQTWSDVRSATCAPPHFQDQGYTDTRIADVGDSFDGFNVTAVWVTSTQDPRYASVFTSSGEPYMAAVPLTYGGYVYQCDIFINGTSTIKWSTEVPTPTGYRDLRTYLLRELGRCMGLSKVLYPWDAVMNTSLPAGESRRVLTDYDKAELCALYPGAGSAVGTPCKADGSCSNGLVCVTAEVGSGETGRLCSKGCTQSTNGECPDPFACKPSTGVPGSTYACLPTIADHITRVGEACGSNPECNSPRGACLQPTPRPSTATAWVGGYCTEACTPGGDACPSGSTCTEEEGFPICLKSCQQKGSDCRSGYVCAWRPEGNVCISPCYADADCGDGLACRLCDGQCLPRRNPSVVIGDACAMDADCGTGQVCLHPNNHPQGFCSQPCSSGSCGCPEGTTCQSVGPDGSSLCVRTCSSQDSCPSGQHCAPFPGGTTGCLPTCRTQADCPSGSTCGSDGRCSAGGSPDAGSCSLCGDPPVPDAGLPSADAGTGSPPGVSGPGCGCQGTSLSSPGLLGALAVLLVVAGRRRRCQRP